MRKLFCFMLAIFLSTAVSLAQEDAEAEQSPLQSISLSRIAALQFEASISYDFTGDSQFLVVGTGTDIQLFKLEGLQDDSEPLLSIPGSQYEISNDGNWLFIPKESEFQIYDLQTISAEAEPLVSFEYGGTSHFYGMSEDERWLYLSYGETLALYDLSSLSAETVPLLSVTAPRFRFNKSYTALATLYNNELKYYDLTAASVSDSAVLVSEMQDDYGFFSFTQSGKILLFGDGTGAEFWDVASQTQSSYAWDMPYEGIYFVSSPDDRFIALDSYSCSPGYCRGEMRVIDISKLEAVYSHPYDRAYLNALKFSSDGNMVAFGTSTTGSWTVGFQTGTSFTDGTIHLVSTETGEELINKVDTDGILGEILFVQDDSRLVYSTIPFLSQFPEWSESVIHVLDIATGEEVLRFEDAGLVSNVLADNPDQLQTTGMIILPGLFLFGGSSEQVLDLAAGSSNTSAFEGMYLGDTVRNEAGTLLISATYNYESSVGWLRFYAPDNKDILMEITINGVSGLSQPELSPDEAYLAVSYYEGVYPTQTYSLLILGLK